MSNLPKFTLTKDEKKYDWVLRNDSTGRVKDRFDTKTEATARGVLEKAVGSGRAR
jgi:hypothetical protein